MQIPLSGYQGRAPGGGRWGLPPCRHFFSIPAVDGPVVAGEQSAPLFMLPLQIVSAQCQLIIDNVHQLQPYTHKHLKDY